MDLTTRIEQLYLVGPQRAKLLKKLGINILEDLLYYFPRTHQDLSKLTLIKDLKQDEFANIKGQVLELKTFRTKVKRLTITQALIEDETGAVLCIWFNQPFLSKVIKPHEIFLFSGKIVREKNKLIVQNPIYEQEKQEQIHTARLVPVYSLTAQLTQKQLRTIIKIYLDKVNLPEYLPEAILKQEQLMTEDEAIKLFHFPPTLPVLKRAQHRLAFDEIFQTQLKVMQSKNEREQNSALAIKDTGLLGDKIASLPYQLTDSQILALKEILLDFQKSFPANRLLEGDVGSGKTIVAALAMWLAAQNGCQAAFIAPTEILAWQHFNNLLEFFEDGLKPILLTSGFKKLGRQDVEKDFLLKNIGDATSKIIFGTHALLEENVHFNHLALVVIDEQHRFGVEQRSTLKQLHNTHLLTMSATPIPRTLALTLYGDLDISILRELPLGRKKVITKLVTEENRDKTYQFINDQIGSGRQVFVICPLIEPSDKLGVKSANEEYKKLKETIFPDRSIGLLHGRMKTEQKENIMKTFKDGQLDILVSTSVIEVGVDVPNASVIIIEAADRFGLAQLHQLRGRVGRSDHQSFCFLFSDDQQSANNPRLAAILESENGFDLAEKDLQIRGAGNLYGTEQSGYNFRIATLSNLDLVIKSREYAQHLLKNDPTLKNHPLLKQKINSLQNVHLE
jgi:ATP-dependent DNA helicase RecG